MKEPSYRTQLQGQAGVWAVSAQLALRGHVPMFPGVDYGFDILLENGLRIQVKSARLTLQRKRTKDEYPGYSFNLRKTVMSYNKSARSVLRDWTKCADFFVLWGIDDNRFWIVPTGEAKITAIRFAQSDPLPLDATGRVKGGQNMRYKQLMARKHAYEGRWDLLSLDMIVEPLVANTEISKEKENAL